MRLFLSYCKSHIYDIHAVLAGTLALILVLLIKKPIKERIAGMVAKRAESDERYRENPGKFRKRYNGILILIDMVFSFLFFVLLSVFSPFIQFSFPTAIMSGVISLAEYAFLEQLCIMGEE